MKCGQCNRRVTTAHNYGGIMLCPTCMDRYNPSCTRIYKMSEKQVTLAKMEICDLQARIQKLEADIRTNDKIIASGYEYLDFTDSVYHTHIKNQIK